MTEKFKNPILKAGADPFVVFGMINITMFTAMQMHLLR